MIGNAVKALLESNAAITTLFGEKIFPVIVPQKISGASLTYGCTGIEVEHSKEESYLNAVKVEIRVNSKDYVLVQNASRTIRATLNKVKGTYSSIEISDIEFKDYTDGWDGEHERFVGVLDFHFYTDENF